MNKILLRIGGGVNLLFVLFHLMMLKPLRDELASLTTDIVATVSMLNIHLAFSLLVFAYLAIFQTKNLLATRLGNRFAIAISLFWFLRATNQIIFYGLASPATPVWSGLCIIFGLLHHIPVLIEGRKSQLKLNVSV